MDNWLQGIIILVDDILNFVLSFFTFFLISRLLSLFVKSGGLIWQMCSFIYLFIYFSDMAMLQRQIRDMALTLPEFMILCWRKC